jgi:hypothetical protein
MNQTRSHVKRAGRDLDTRPARYRSSCEASLSLGRSVERRRRADGGKVRVLCATIRCVAAARQYSRADRFHLLGDDRRWVVREAVLDARSEEGSRDTEVAGSSPLLPLTYDPRTLPTPNEQACAITLDQSHHLHETADLEAPVSPS